MIKVQTEIIINKPIKEVSSFSADPNNEINWYKNLISIQWKTSKPIQLNSKIAYKSKFLGRLLSYTFEVVFYEEQKRIMMKSKEGPFLMTTIYTWSSIDENTTLMKIENQGNPNGFFHLIKPLMPFLVRKSSNESLKKLKEILENN